VSVYSISLFLHIVGAWGLFAALGLEWAGLSNLRRATGTDQAREWARLLAAPRAVGGPAGLVILASDIYMTATRWGPQAWIVASLAGIVVIALLGATISGRRAAAIVRALQESRGPMTADLHRLLHDPGLILGLRVRGALLLGVVFLMSNRPGAAGALAAMGAALVLGIAAAMPAFGGGRRAARVAGSER